MGGMRVSLANKAEFDVLVVGGGLVGASLACALGEASLRVGIVEAAPFGVQEPSTYDDRSLALSLGTQRILRTLGLWEHLADAVNPICAVHVSERGQFGVTRFRARHEGVSALGYVTDARTLGEVLKKGLVRHSNVTLLCPARVMGVFVEQDNVRVGLQGIVPVPTVCARVLVAADGARSTVRELMGLSVHERDYHESAITANVTPTVEHRDTAYERFTDDGTIALLPMKGGRCGLIWTAPSQRAEELLDLDEAAFLVALNRTFGWRLGKFLQVGHRVYYPLRLVSAKDQAFHRVVIIGNAAHTLHPIAAQGFNLGLRDAATLAEVLVDAWRAGQDPGSLAVLHRYTDARRRDQQEVALVTDSLARLFSIRSTLWSPLRGMGLLALDLLPWVKHQVARRAMGLAGRQTRLARGVPLYNSELGT